MTRVHQSAVASLLVCTSWLLGCSADKGSGAIINSERLNSFELMTAATVAQTAGRTEDAGFLFFAAQARFQIDKQVFPPVETGADSPNVLKSALSATVGQAIQPALATQPTAYANIAIRLAKWSPKFDQGYDPGWKYANRLGDQAAARLVASTLAALTKPLQSRVKLFGNEEYRRLSGELADFRTLEQRFWAAMNRGGPDRVPNELKKEYQDSLTRKNAVAQRLKEIEFEQDPASRWHAQVGWNAADFFNNQQVIALCHAIENDDVAEMERLIAAGADVNAVGKNGMTPLLWAFPERKLERFECLLKHGANPNVIIKSDFGIGPRPFHAYPAGGRLFDDRGCHAGQSVTHLAARSPFIDYLKLVLAHGADPNLVDTKTGEVPLDIVLNRHLFDAAQRVELLVANNANLDRYCEYKLATPAMQAVSNDQYGIALSLLESGADPRLYQPDGVRRLVHFVVRNEHRLSDFPPPMAADFQNIEDWLEEHGESLEQARNDEQQWAERFKQAFTPDGHAKIRGEIIREQRRGERPTATQ